jgi:hypothetical protein
MNKIYIYAVNQQTHADKIWFITYYHIHVFYHCEFVGLLQECKYFLMHGYGTYEVR